MRIILGFSRLGQVVLFSNALFTICEANPLGLVKATTLEASSNLILHQNIAANPPLPILGIGLKHQIALLSSHFTNEGNETSTQPHSKFSLRDLSSDALNSPPACGPGRPCIDGSCCNSDGKCGYTSYTCRPSSTAHCISNCDVPAACGVDSLDGSQKCPYNLCCSSSGYCGTSNLFCTAGTNTPTPLLPCQSGYGSCQVVPPPSCKVSDQTTTRGRQTAYWQSGNVRYRKCDRVAPPQINVNDITHLYFAFVGFDPQTFRITSVDPIDTILYPLFTALKSNTMQTWIAVGGGGFSDPGSATVRAWSEMASTFQTRAVFIVSLLDFMNKWGFQGVNLDWEYPTIANRGGQPADSSNFVSLVREMRTAYGKKFGISVSVPLDFTNLVGYDSIAMEPYLDFLNVMAYDLHGPWESSYGQAKIQPQTSILDIASGMQPFWFAGLDPRKLNLGLANYGRGYKFSKPSCSGFGCPYSGSSEPGACTDSEGILSLQEIKDLIRSKNLTPKLNTDHLIKEIVWDGNWMGYDDEDTFVLKRQWADSHCIGGTVAWSADMYSAIGSINHIKAVTTEGRCGLTNANILSCNGSALGECCSSDGYCGSGLNFCSVSNGCQSAYGKCGEQVVLPMSVDGSCGPGSGATCQGSVFGKCCSPAGYCGSTTPYCGGGCQAGFGTCC